MWEKLGKVCQVAVRRVIADSAAAEEKRKVGVCFAVQKSEFKPDWDSLYREKIVESMILLFQSKMGESKSNREGE